MKKLLTILLSVLMCVCLVNINTNRVVKAEDENNQPLTEEVVEKEEIPEEEAPAEEEKKEEVPEEEKEKEEEITPEEEKEIEEVIEEIKEELEKEEVAKDNLLTDVNAASSFTIVIKPNETGDARISYVNESGQPVTPSSAPTGISFDSNNNLVLSGFDFASSCSTAIKIVGLTDGQTLNIKLIGKNSIVAGCDVKESTDRYGIYNDGAGTINFTSGQSSQELENVSLSIMVYASSKYNYGIYSKGDIKSSIKNYYTTVEGRKSDFTVEFDTNENAVMLGTLCGFRSLKNIELTGNNYVFCNFDAHNEYGETSVGFLADGDIVITGDATNIPIAGVCIDQPLEGAEGGYFAAGFVGNKIVVDNANLYSYFDGTDYDIGLISSTIEFKGSPVVSLYSANPDSLLTSTPILGDGIKGLAEDYYSGSENYVKYDVNNIKRYKHLIFKNKNIYSLHFNSKYVEIEDINEFEDGGIKQPLPDISGITGYTLEGWYKEPSLTTRVGGPGDEYILTKADEILYAKWNATPTILSYSLGGGVIGQPFNQQLKLVGYEGTDYKWVIKSGSLPSADFKLNENTGVVSCDKVPSKVSTKSKVTIAAVKTDGSEAVITSQDFTMVMNESTIIDFSSDPAKALMLIKKYDSKATYEASSLNYGVLTIHDLNYVSENGCGIILPKKAVLIVHGTNNIKVNGYYDVLENIANSESNAASILAKMSQGIVCGNLLESSTGILNIINGDSNKTAKLTVNVNSDMNVTDLSVGLFATRLTINDVDCDFVAGGATTYSFGYIGSLGYYLANGDDETENKISSSEMKINSANVNFTGSKTLCNGSNMSSVGIMSGVSVTLKNNSQLTAKGEDAAMMYTYINDVLLNDEEDSLQMTKNSLGNYMVYGSNTPDGEANTILSDDSLNRRNNEYKNSGSFYMGDGNEIVKKLVFKNAKYRNPLYFNKADHKFYKDSLYTQVVSDYKEGTQYTYDGDNNVLTLNNFVFETSSRMGLIFDGDITIKSAEGTSNIINCEKYRGGIGLYATGDITIDGKGKLQIFGEMYGIAAPEGEVKIKGGTNRIVGNVGIYTGKVEDEDAVTVTASMTIDGGDTYIYGCYAPIEFYYQAEGTLILKDGLINIDTHFDNKLDFEINTENYNSKYELYAGSKTLGYPGTTMSLFGNRYSYIGMEAVNYKYVSKANLTRTINWLKSVEPKTKEFYTPIIFTKDTDGDFGWFKYEYTGQSEFKPSDKLTIQGTSFDATKGILTLNNFKDYKFYGNTAIMLPEGITVNLIGNNEITLNPLHVVLSKVDSSNNKDSRINQGIISTIKFYRGKFNDYTASEFTGKGNLTLNVNDSDRVFDLTMTGGIAAGEFSTKEIPSLGNVIFDGTGTIEINAGNDSSSAGVLAQDIIINNGQKMDININSSVINMGLYATRDFGVYCDDASANINIKAKKGNISNIGIAAMNTLETEGKKKAYINIECDGGTLPLGLSLLDGSENGLSIYGQSAGMVNMDALNLENADVKIKINDSSIGNVMGILYTGSINTSKTSLDIKVGNTYRGVKTTLNKNVPAYSVGMFGENTEGAVTFDASTVTIKTGNAHTASAGMYAYNGAKIKNKSVVNVTAGNAGHQTIGIYVKEGSKVYKFARSYNRGDRLASSINDVYLSSNDGSLLVIDNSKVTVNSGKAMVSYGIYSNSDVDIVNKSVVNTTAGDAVDDTELQMALSYGITVGDNMYSTPIFEDNILNLVKNDVLTLQTSNALQAPVQRAYFASGYVNEDVPATLTIKDSELVATSGNATGKDDYSTQSIGVYAENVDMKSGSLTAKSKSSSYMSVGNYSTNMFTYEDGKLIFEVEGLKVDNASTYYLGFVAKNVSENMKKNGFIKYPAGSSVSTYSPINDNYTILNKDGEPATVASNQGIIPTPTPSPKKDESCEKVIGPYWHWNNDKGVCEEIYVVGTSTR